MDNWVKIDGGTRGRPRSSGFRVRRVSSHRKSALLIIPKEFYLSERADWLASGTKIAVHQHDDGGYSVFQSGGRTNSFSVTIPSTFRERIPFGTTPVGVTHEDGMIVIDLSQLPAVQEAAE